MLLHLVLFDTVLYLFNHYGIINFLLCQLNNIFMAAVKYVEKVFCKLQLYYIIVMPDRIMVGKVCLWLWFSFYESVLVHFELTCSICSLLRLWNMLEIYSCVFSLMKYWTPKFPLKFTFWTHDSWENSFHQACFMFVRLWHLVVLEIQIHMFCSLIWKVIVYFRNFIFKQVFSFLH